LPVISNNHVGEHIFISYGRDSSGPGVRFGIFTFTFAPIIRPNMEVWAQKQIVKT
jgi:hypothetical protein